MQALIEHAVTAGKRVFFPILDHQSLKFARWTEQTCLQKNRFGIDEPIDSETIPTKQLDLVLAPLVAFDQQGTRLGMGGGYYDRTFAFLAECARPAGLKLVGVAYEFQRAILPEPRSWDIPLDAVVTELGWQSMTR